MFIYDFIQRFWKQRSLLNFMILPFTWIYRIIHYCNYNIIQVPKKVDAVVICVGNIVAGGAGKTPTAIAIAKMLIARNKKVAFISRGYGGQTNNVSKVSVTSDPLESGDEAILLARVAPTYVARSRCDAAQFAVNEGAKYIIVDDGMQNNTIFKNFNILVVNQHYKFGNGMSIPSGPLRESISSALRKADVGVIIRNLPITDEQDNVVELNDLEKVYASLIIKNSDKIEGKSFILLCAIARPEILKAMILKLKVCLIDEYIYPDHHHFSEDTISKLISRAKAHNCKILTTEKDFVKITSDSDRFFVIESYLRFDSEDFINDIFKC